VNELPTPQFTGHTQEPDMSQLHQFLATIQSDGVISDSEVPLIREKLSEDGKLDLQDVKLLIELYCESANRSPAFDSLFFSVLEGVFLEDGQINPSEEYYLLKMLYSDREIHEPELEFLRRLRRQLPERSASFEALFETAVSCPQPDRNVGERQSAKTRG
jgi:hypothetical protein